MFVNWKNYGHFYAGKVARSNPDGTYLIHFDDGDVEDHVNMGRIKPLDENSEAVQAYIEHDNEAERELIEAFEVFDTTGTGTISAHEYLRILTEIGDEPLSVEDVLNEFVELGIELDSEIDYRALAKFMVASEQHEADGAVKQEVLIKDAAIEGNILSGYAYEHPKLGEGRINSSSIVSVTYDENATARVETKTPCTLLDQPVGRNDLQTIHSTPSALVRVLIEWNGAMVPTVPFWKSTATCTASPTKTTAQTWDEWVDASRLKSIRSLTCKIAVADVPGFEPGFPA